MSLRIADYQQRDVEHGVLYRVIEDHLETFLDAAADHGLMAMGIGAGGLREFLEARDGGFRPEPFGPKSKPAK